MKNRNPFVVLVLAFVTFGIYGLVWLVKTKGEMVAKGAEIPTSWLLIVPIANIWYLWKWSMGVEKVTSNGMSAAVAFLLIMLLGPIGAMVIQSKFNNEQQGSVQAAGSRI